MPAIKNILIFVAIAGIFVFIYIFYFKSSPEGEDALVSSSGEPVISGEVPASAAESNALAQDFINLLLNVKNIKLDDAIFSDPAFLSLDGSHSITLIPDGTEGRPNPFAPIGIDIGEIMLDLLDLEADAGADEGGEGEEMLLEEEALGDTAGDLP